MNRTKAITTFLISLLLSAFFFAKNISAQTNVSFVVDTNTTITYKTGDDFVTIKNEYTRAVKDSSYYLPKEGEKVFHITDSKGTAEEIQGERALKLKSLTVTDHRGNKVAYKVQELELGEGMYINIPYYRATIATMPYKIIMTYTTRDNIFRSVGRTTILGYALPKDTVFQKVVGKNEATAQFNYNLSIVTDKNIEPLAKAFPLFTKEEGEGVTIYKFSQEERRGNTPTLEFGTKAKYKFEVEYKTPKTDNTMPEKY